MTVARIYYGDGSVYEGEPEQAPTDNVQAIVWADAETGPTNLGRIVLSEWDIYIYSDHVGGWHGTNKYADLLRHLKHGCGPGGVRAVLEGCWINRDTWKEIIQRARKDIDFPPKSANDPPREDGSE